MANVLGLYDPLFYAQEALIQLEKSLGMAGRVFRGYDRNPQDKGSTIQIRRPTYFTATDMPAASTDLNPDTVSLVLNNWKGVQFGLTDKDLSFTKEVIIAEHIRPSSVAVADAIDATLNALYKDIPWFYDGAATPSDVSDFTGVQKILFDNKVPMDDLHLEICSERQAKYLNLTAFTQYQGAGDQGVSSQMRGALGEKFGFEIFANQNVVQHSTTALTAVTQLQLNAGAAKGATTIAIKDSDGVLAGTIAKGDTLLIAGNTQRYAVTAASVAAANVFTLTITPGLAVAGNTNDNVTLRQADGKNESLGFHRGAFALAMAPLSDLGNQLGAKIPTVTHPITALSARIRLF